MIVKWVYFFVTHAHKRWWSQKKEGDHKKSGNHKKSGGHKKRWQSQTSTDHKKTVAITKKWRSQKTEVFTFLTIVLHLLLPSIILNLQENSSKFSNNFRISLIMWYFIVLRILINESFLIKIFSLWIESFRGTASVFLRPHVSKLSLAAKFFFLQFLIRSFDNCYSQDHLHTAFTMTITMMLTIGDLWRSSGIAVQSDRPPLGGQI